MSSVIVPKCFILNRPLSFGIQSNMRSIVPILLSFPLSLYQAQLSTNFIHSDKTIRPFNDSNDANGFCLYKRWADYVSGQELWMWPCQDATHSNTNKAGKYWWSYDSTTGLIQSEGSYILRPHKPFCWFVIRPTSMYAQRLKIKACDASDKTRFLR